MVQRRLSIVGNFLTDLMRICRDADCALVNGGAFFGDKVYHSEELFTTPS